MQTHANGAPPVAAMPAVVKVAADSAAAAAVPAAAGMLLFLRALSQIIALSGCQRGVLERSFTEGGNCLCIFCCFFPGVCQLHDAMFHALHVCHAAFTSAEHPPWLSEWRSVPCRWSSSSSTSTGGSSIARGLGCGQGRSGAHLLLAQEHKEGAMGQAKC